MSSRGRALAQKVHTSWHFTYGLPLTEATGIVAWMLRRWFE
jgi:hypothetical protein